MSASIRVESGIAAGTNYWIDRPVLRIGSDPQCDICLPSAELAPHALTLEFRGGSYRVYNRGTSPVTVGRSAVQAGANGPWNDAESALLPGNLQLLLTIDGDPRPSPRPELPQEGDLMVDETAAAVDGVAGVPDAVAAQKKSSKTMLQLAVIGFCVLAMIALLTLGGGGETATSDRPTFDAIVRDTLGKEQDDPARAFLPQLQYAQAALVRDNKPQAKTRFLKLRDQLVLQMETLPENSRDDAKRMLDYVEFRLGQLQ
jgi:hypothetical protein